jgi:hypothetical protein
MKGKKNTSNISTQTGLASRGQSLIFQGVLEFTHNPQSLPISKASRCSLAGKQRCAVGWLVMNNTAANFSRYIPLPFYIIVSITVVRIAGFLGSYRP